MSADNTPGSRNGSSAQAVTREGAEGLTQITGVRADFLEEVIPELSHERRERSGDRGLPGRGVCVRK